MPIGIAANTFVFSIESRIATTSKDLRRMPVCLKQVEFRLQYLQVSPYT